MKCDRYLTVVDRLIETTNRLDKALLRMRSLIGSQKPDEFATALKESRSLRMQCEVMRDALQRHRAEHGELPK
jgi:hypothetical protein